MTHEIESIKENENERYIQLKQNEQNLENKNKELLKRILI